LASLAFAAAHSSTFRPDGPLSLLIDINGAGRGQEGCEIAPPIIAAIELSAPLAQGNEA